MRVREYSAWPAAQNDPGYRSYPQKRMCLAQESKNNEIDQEMNKKKKVVLMMKEALITPQFHNCFI